jgi:hypothetical protein
MKSNTRVAPLGVDIFYRPFTRQSNVMGGNVKPADSHSNLLGTPEPYVMMHHLFHFSLSNNGLVSVPVWRVTS